MSAGSISSANTFKIFGLKGRQTFAGTHTGERDVCVLFVDGPAFRCGALLAAELEQRGLILRLGYRLFSTLPTVTADRRNPQRCPSKLSCTENRERISHFRRYQTGHVFSVARRKWSSVESIILDGF